MTTSIRWRLSLSYAAIALLAALALGAVLLATLRGYYAQRELEYLSGNARAISQVIAAPMKAGMPSKVLLAQIQGLSFLSQVRVRLAGADGSLMADTGLRDASRFLFITGAPAPGDPATVITRSWTEAIEAGDSPLDVLLESPGSPFLGSSAPSVVVISDKSPSAAVQVSQIIKRAEPSNGGLFLAAAGTPYGFGLSADVAPDGRRSNQVVRQPVLDEKGESIGYVELSEGPAYGSQVVDQVARGWAIAGLAAVLLAAGVGWLVSGRISAPLLALTAATEGMAAGDLSARAAVVGKDEIGTLARSFNGMAGRVEGTVLALRRFVADAAHELHTPLTALRTNLELAGTAGEPAGAQAYLERAQAQVRRLQCLTDSLLDLSRIEANALALQAPADLRGLVHKMSEIYASQAEQAGLAFSLDIPGGPVWVCGNEAQLQEALDNLMDNAVKFTPEGGHVTIGLHRQGDLAQLWVQDSGIGIPVEDLPRLGERFHRGRNAAPYPGNGLGLAIVWAIAAAHGGNLQAGNTAGGARICLQLPICQGDRRHSASP